MVLINDNSKVLKVGDPMPHFKLPSTTGDTVDSRKLKEQIVAVVFTCNHCPYALAAESRLIQIADEFMDRNVQFVLVCSNDAANYPEDSFEEMQKRAEEMSYPFPYCQDEDQSVAKAFGALCTPHCFVFGKDGKLAYKGRIDDNWKDPDAVKSHDLQNAIQALVEGRKPEVTEANAIGCSIKWKE
jgi:peroxiredoxin